MIRQNRHCEEAKPTRQSIWIASLTLAMTILTLLVTACGFHPQYGVNKYTAVGVEDKLALVDIGSIPDREGQYLRNALIDRFYRDGRPANTKYTLNISPVKETLIDLDITKTSDATRKQLRLETIMSFKNKQTGEVLLNRKIQTITSYNILGSEFSTRVSEDNTRLNALDDLARQIEQQIALYLKRTQ